LAARRTAHARRTKIIVAALNQGLMKSGHLVGASLIVAKLLNDTR
jgi:hypothetical protein